MRVFLSKDFASDSQSFGGRKKGKKRLGILYSKCWRRRRKERKKERKKERGDPYRKNKFGFERQKDPPKKKDRFKIFRVWGRTESATEKKAFEGGIVEVIRLRERDHKEG
jgi:hypothetical protein